MIFDILLSCYTLMTLSYPVSIFIVGCVYKGSEPKLPLLFKIVLSLLIYKFNSCFVLIKRICLKEIINLSSQIHKIYFSGPCSVDIGYFYWWYGWIYTFHALLTAILVLWYEWADKDAMNLTASVIPDIYEILFPFQGALFHSIQTPKFLEKGTLDSTEFAPLSNYCLTHLKVYILVFCN